MLVISTLLLNFGDEALRAALSSIANFLSNASGRALTAQNFLNRFSALLLMCVTFPSMVVTGALFEEWASRWPLSWLGHFGDSTYATYLVHFPLQIVIILALDAFGLPRTVAASWWFFCLFFGALLAVSLVVFRYFERPAQTWLRRLLVPAKQAVHAGAR